jgi:hypothetical protein
VSDHETMHERESEGSAVRARPCRCRWRSCKGVWPRSRRGPYIVTPHLLLFELTDPTECGGRSSAGRRRFAHFLRRGGLSLASTSSSPEGHVLGQRLVFGHGDLIVLSQGSLLRRVCRSWEGAARIRLSKPTPLHASTGNPDRHRALGLRNPSEHT